MSAPALLDTSKVIVGASGSGKTVTAKADVEQLLDERRHLVVIDPTGVWWGMRSTAAGDGPGYDLPIFGGAHGDLPIRADQGVAIARIVVEQRVSAIVDLSAITNSRDWRRFMRDFVAELRILVRGNFHIVVDEADEFAAQTTQDDVGFELLQDLVWMAKRGRVQGFVPTWITQRPADIAKAVISQAQTIVAHQLILAHDQKAIDDYLKSRGSAEVRKEVMSSLAELPIGERWVYSPRLKILERGVTPPIRTFDSSRTPAPGEQLVAPRTLAHLDVSAIAAALAPPARENSENEPLGAVGGDCSTARIGELEVQVAQLTDALAEAQRIGDVLFSRGIVIGLGRAQDALATLVRDHAARTEKAPLDAATVRSFLSMKPANEDSAGETAAEGEKDVSTAEDAPAASGASDTALRRGRKALAPLAEIYPAALSEPQWATLAGFAKSGGTWSTYKGALRAAGHVRQDAGGLWQATREGCAAAGVKPAQLPPIGADRALFWGVKIPGVRRMVDVLIKRWPHYTAREALAADLGMAASGGTFSTYLGRLRTNGLLDEQKSRVRLAAEIMGAAR